MPVASWPYNNNMYVYYLSRELLEHIYYTAYQACCLSI